MEEKRKRAGVRRLRDFARWLVPADPATIVDSNNALGKGRQTNMSQQRRALGAQGVHVPPDSHQNFNDSFDTTHM